MLTISRWRGWSSLSRLPSGGLSRARLLQVQAARPRPGGLPQLNDFTTAKRRLHDYISTTMTERDLTGWTTLTGSQQLKTVQKRRSVRFLGCVSGQGSSKLVCFRRLGRAAPRLLGLRRPSSFGSLGSQHGLELDLRRTRMDVGS